MAKISLRTADAGCRKKGCKYNGPLHRHHYAHEQWIIRRWDRPSSRWLKALKARRDKFLEEDIVRLCPRHHAEIHWIYSAWIRDFVFQSGKMFVVQWTTKDAQSLMDRLRSGCLEWLKIETPGIDPDVVGWHKFSEDFDGGVPQLSRRQLLRIQSKFREQRNKKE